MKKILTITLLTFALQAIGQKKSKLQLSFQLQPELTFHQNQYSSISTAKHTKSTFNFGVSSAVQYNLTNRIFFDIGIGYIERRLNTSAILDQATLPQPHYSASKELNYTDYLSYKTLQIPVNFGYVLIEKNRFKSFILLGISSNYLLKAKYKVGNPQYDDSYKKGYWQGLSFNGGIGTDLRLTKNTTLTNSITYSFINSVQKDKFLVLKRDEGGIALSHNYLRLSIGIKTAL
jgi:hypothetical protein